MQQPRPSSSSPASRNVRLLVAGVVAGLGMILMLAGLQSIASRAVAPGSPAAAVPNGPGSAPPGSDAPSAPGSILQPSTGDPVLVGAGDIVRCDATNDEATAEIVERTAGIVFTLGDNVYERGTAAEFRDCFGPSWGRFKDRIALPIPGNHDYKTRDAQGYREYFGDAAVRNGTTWYSQDVGTWHVVVLDSECGLIPNRCGPDSPQAQWLRADLAQSDARCTLALWHHPRFSSGYHGNDKAVAPFWDALYAAGADLVLNGHEHDYERFAPQDPQGAADPARGLTEIIVGTGGGELRGFETSQPNVVVRSSVAYGVIVLTLSPSGWAYRFESTDGSFSDSGTGTCH